MNIASSDVYTTALSEVHRTKVRLADVHRDGAVILSSSSRDAVADAEAFGEAITETIGESRVSVVRIVCLKGVPRALHSVARRMIRKHERGGGQLLLDWKAAFHAALQLDPNVSHFLVVGSSGDVKGPVSGGAMNVYPQQDVTGTQTAGTESI